MDSNLGRRRFSDAGASLYSELELEKGATPDEIKKAYRRLALRYHPDKNPGDNSAAEKFKELNKANRTLSDPVKKAIYDQYGSLGLHIAENFGEENVKYYFLITSWWCKALCGVCCILTGCYFCCCCLCCCNCCCGKCAPKVEDEDIPDAADLAAEIERDHDGQPTTTQPRGGNSPIGLPDGDKSPRRSPISTQPKAGNNTIVLGPPPSSPINQQPKSGGAIVLGPPSSVSPTERSDLNSGSSAKYDSTGNW